MNHTAVAVAITWILLAIVHPVFVMMATGLFVLGALAVSRWGVDRP